VAALLFTFFAILFSFPLLLFYHFYIYWHVYTLFVPPPPPPPLWIFTPFCYSPPHVF
jgi:hypothetical protein